MQEMIRRNGLWIPNPAVIRAWMFKGPGDNIAAVLSRKGRTERLPSIVDVIVGENIVTDAGDEYYAQKACGESPTHVFSDMYLASAGPGTPSKTDVRTDFTDISGSNKTKSGGYPKTNDTDADNPGMTTDTITWLFSYSTSDGDWSGITHAYITVNAPGAGEHLLTSIKFAAGWAKDSNTSAKVFVNHNQLGV